MVAASIRTVVVDASVLINLIHVKRLDLFGKLGGFEFVVPEQVVEEVKYPDQVTVLNEALARGWVRKEPSTDVAEIALYAELSGVMGKGEAACLAMAQRRGWLVACDEAGRFRREAEARLARDRLVNTPGLMVLAIRRGLLTVEEADRTKEVLATRNYRMRFRSFRDLLEGQ